MHAKSVAITTVFMHAEFINIATNFIGVKFIDTATVSNSCGRSLETFLSIIRIYYVVLWQFQLYLILGGKARQVRE